ncbi:hypothetical protein Hdeb2414_s0140g00810561 [Helianthus debilis subsp. tardiflorus]
MGKYFCQKCKFFDDDDDDDVSLQHCMLIFCEDMTVLVGVWRWGWWCQWRGWWWGSGGDGGCAVG